jgi:uracil-DNA glycosylase
LTELAEGRKTAFEALRNRIISCRKCPRLIDYISRVSNEKVRRYCEWSYWGRPLPGYGDPEARLLVIGLAPAAHGGNRTGRMFTGDSSEYLREEARILTEVETVLTLGRIAFDAYVRYVLPKTVQRPRFKHGGFYMFGDLPSLITSYHPSRQNTRTGRLTWEMWMEVFMKIKQIMA